MVGHKKGIIASSKFNRSSRKILFEHHVEEEEGEMFKQARKVLSDDEVEMLGDRLQEAKKQNRAAAAS